MVKETNRPFQDVPDVKQNNESTSVFKGELTNTGLKGNGIEWESELEDVSDKIYIRILKPTRSVKRQECWTEEGTHVKNSVKRS